MATLKTPITPRDHRRGDPKALVTLVEYGDYQCPHCAAAHPVVRELLRSFDEDLALVYRHFPLAEVHPLAATAAAEDHVAREVPGRSGDLGVLPHWVRPREPARQIPSPRREDRRDAHAHDERDQ